MTEWRKDALLDRWVVVAAERGKRPGRFMPPEEKKIDGKKCPLCEHHEGETPPEIFACRDCRDNVRDCPGWRVRVVPNKFPAVRMEGFAFPEDTGVYQSMPGIGAHELVIETPEHGAALEDLCKSQVQDVIRVWRDRSRELGRDSRIKYIQVFKNFGSAGGASLEHSHSQIVAIPMVPFHIRDKMANLERHARAAGRCILCEIIAREERDEIRVVAGNDSFLCIAPFASRFPYETWIIPREHQPDYGQIGEEQAADLAAVMRFVLKRLAAALDRPAYNMVINTAPVNDHVCDTTCFHWHMEVLPRLSVAAGFELGTGLFINTVSPEVAAHQLRCTV